MIPRTAGGRWRYGRQAYGAHRRHGAAAPTLLGAVISVRVDRERCLCSPSATKAAVHYPDATTNPGVTEDV
jgi:hypothetical protein